MNWQLGLARMLFNSRRHEFYADLAEALEDKGVLTDILRDNAERCRKRKDIEGTLFEIWLRRMDEGSFAEALAGTVPQMDVMSLRAADASNRLPVGLRFLAQAIEASRKMRGAIISAVAAPLFVVTILLGLLIGFSVWMVPVLEQIMPPAAWPLIGRMLYGLARFVVKVGPYLGVLVGAGCVLFIWSLPRWAGRYRILAERVLPPYAIYRDYTGAIFLVSLASLMKAGNGLAEGLKELRKGATPWLAWHIDEILHRLDSNADQPAKAFETGIFNQRLTDRVVDYGKRASKFNDAISKVGLSSVDKITEAVTGSATKLNWMLLLIAGGLFAFMISGVMLTAQHAQTAVRQQVNQFH